MDAYDGEEPTRRATLQDRSARLPRLLYRDSYRDARRGDVQYEYEEALYVQEDGWMAAHPDARAVYRRGVGAAFDGEQRTAVAEEHTCTTCALASRRAWLAWPASA